MRAGSRVFAGLLLVAFAAAVGGAVAAETPEAAAELLARGAPPLMMAGRDHSIAPLPGSAQQPNPLEPQIRQLRTTLPATASSRAPSGITANDYATIAFGIVQYFRRWQAQNGRIVDPFLQREFQFSTPAYAAAAATLAEIARRPDLLESAAHALDSSLFQLASATPADRHGDFFIIPTMYAFERLHERADAATRARWDRYLRMIDPKVAYSDLVGAGQADVINWNTAAIAGEFMRHKRGYTDTVFVDRYLAAQVPHFTPAGIYRDPGVPLAYDAEARFNLLVLLENGYAGPQQQALETLLERGAWASLMMQSPSGDAPLGGRSADHVWNDALACAAYEMWAHRSKAKGDMVAASAFKRAARMAARSVARWVRPSGELWIVKNHFDPAVRRGFEPYSSHSQYNLVAAAYLAFAAAVADETIPEGASPADTGGFVAPLPELHKVFANSRGHYVEIDTGADTAYDSTGLVRIHRRGMDNAIGPTSSAPAGASPLAVGVEWPDGKGGWEALAQFGQGKVRAATAVASASPDKVEFTVRYELAGAAATAVAETYTLTPEVLTVAARIDGAPDRWKLAFPAFIADGYERGTFAIGAEGMIVRTASSAQAVSIAADKPQLVRSGRIVQMRTGDYEAMEWAGAGKQVTYRIGAPARRTP